MKFYIITKGAQHYALYECIGIKTRKHVWNLDISQFDNLVDVRKAFRNIINVLHPNEKYALDFKG